MVEVSFSPVGFVLIDVAIKPHKSQTMEYVTYKVDDNTCVAYHQGIGQ